MLGGNEKMIREKNCLNILNRDRANWKKATPRIYIYKNNLNDHFSVATESTFMNSEYIAKFLNLFNKITSSVNAIVDIFFKKPYVDCWWYNTTSTT